MSYNTFLDTFFSSFWYTLGLCGFFLLIGYLFRNPLYIKRKYKGWLGALYFAFFMYLIFQPLIINPNQWGYGPAIDIEAMRTEGNTLLVMDYILEAGGEGDDPTPMYRVHFMDLASGEKKFRKLVGRNYELMRLTREAVVVERNNSELLFIDRNDGHQLALLNRETLPGLYPEIAPGIDQVNIDRYAGEMFVSVINGRHYIISMDDRRIHEQTEKGLSLKDTTGPRLKTEESSIRDRRKYGEPAILSLGSRKNSDKIKELYGEGDSLLNRELSFLDGRFIGFSEKRQAAFILHYETTEKRNFILTAVSFDGKKKLWEVRQRSLPVETREIPPEIRWEMAEQADALLVSANGTVLLLDAASGKLKWSQRL